MVVGVVVKMLVVAVMVASMKRLTVAITVSAFALLFLEYAGKRVVSCPSVAVESLSQRVCSCVWFRKLLLHLPVKKDYEQATVQVGGAELSSGSLSVDEIEVVEAKSEVGICVELDSLIDGDMTWGYSELVEGDSSKGKVVEPCPSEVSECKIRGSRSGRFKSKMVKKLVPKKFRACKKEKKEKGSKQNEAESGSEVSSAVEEDKLPSLEIEEEEREDVGKEEEERLKTKLECIRDDDVDCGITSSQQSPLAKGKRIDRVGNSGYAILLIITLVGLLVGRFPALILTMAWCFLLKIVKILRRSQNVPLIKCSGPNS